MAFYQYNEVTRELVQISDLEIAPDTNLPVSYIEISKADLLSFYTWDPSIPGFTDKVSRILTKRQFLKKFTPEEYSTIKAATTANGVVDYYWQLFMVAEYVNLDDQDTAQGIMALEQLGLIGQGRSAEILA